MATYPVRCECGKTHQVPGSAAGTALACDCRRTVEIPSFAKLKSSVGELSVSVDLLIPHMLASGELPVESECVLCYQRTDSTVVAVVECEREKMSQKNTLVWYEILMLPISWMLVVVSYFNRQKYSRLIGKDVIFRLPVRICETCKPDVQSASQVRDALLKTDLYRQLFEKYPQAIIR